jgi:hypothetical protein
MIVEVFRDDSERPPMARDLEKLNRGISPRDYERIKTRVNTPTICTPRYNLAPFQDGQNPWCRICVPDGGSLDRTASGETAYFPPGEYWNGLLAETLLEKAKTRGSGYSLDGALAQVVIYRARLKIGPAAGWLYALASWPATDGLPTPDSWPISVPPLSRLVERGEETVLTWPPFEGRAEMRTSTGVEVAEMALRGWHGFAVADGSKPL